MKKLLSFILIFTFVLGIGNLFADENPTVDAVSGEAEVLKSSKSESSKTEEAEEEESELQKRKDTLSFGLESEITDLISTLL